jgi:hypothetical protein
MDTIQITINAVREASLLGITSTEITKATGITNNRITAALSRLHDVGCVRREKIYGYAVRFRYWYVRDPTPEDLATKRAPEIDVPVTRRIEGHTPKASEVPMPPPPPPRRPGYQPDIKGVSIRLVVGSRGHVSVTPEQARNIFNQLRVIFGD